MNEYMNTRTLMMNFLPLCSIMLYSSDLNNEESIVCYALNVSCLSC